MASISSVPKTRMKVDLLGAAAECSLRGLTNAVKWLSELASILEVPDDNVCNSAIEVITQDKVLLAEYDKYLLGKSYFDSKEFARAAFHLKGLKSQPSIFLYYYSRYMEVEKKKRYHMVDILSEGATKEKKWKDMFDLRSDLKKQEDNLDGYGYYLYGVVLAKMDLIGEAIENLVCGIQMQPMNWAAWLELVGLCKERSMLKELPLPKHWMSEFFYAHAELELHMNEEALVRYLEISNAGFEKSPYVKSQVATVHYNTRDFDLSVLQFKELYELDPYKLENVDTFSNILYVQDDRAELSYLALHVCEVDKYRAETCGVIGNYYSLRGEHEKSILYFKQALRINPNYVPAWTLLGHEHVQLRNTYAAIESYRKATELNSRDYRAWYGLGQMYEILNMPFYSLHYFQEAQKLRPNDPRMIIALGVTYQYIDKTDEAKKCFMKAIHLGDADGQATMKLAKLQENCGAFEEAAKLHAINLAKFENSNRPPDDLAKSCLFLARYHLKHKRFDQASEYARKATFYDETREQARTLLFEINAKANKSQNLS